MIDKARSRKNNGLFTKSMTKLYFDAETTTLNKGHPFNPNNELISYAYCTIPSDISFQYFSDPDFRSTLSSQVGTASTFVGFNAKFDLHWCARYGVVLKPDCKVWDCMLAEFVLSGQTIRFGSLNEALESYGIPQKFDKVAEYWKAGIDTKDIPVHILEEYNKYDVECLPRLEAAQKALMDAKQIALTYLLGEDLKAIQHAEFNGIKWDADKAQQKLADYKAKLDAIERRLAENLPPIEHGRFNWDSGDHLSAFLYGGVIDFPWFTEEDAVYKSGEKKGEEYVRRRHYIETVNFERRFTPLDGTEIKKTKDDPTATTHLYQTDAPTLLQLKSRRKADKELLVDLQARSEMIKVVEMIESIERKRAEMNWTDNMLHPQFNQNVVITGRLSSSAPNMQNTPEEVDELLVSRYDY